MKAEGEPSLPLSALGPERRRGALDLTGCLQPDSTAFEMEVKSARNSGCQT
jgi:hypothetical protein